MSATPPHANRLAGETSPYLLQHAHNPVDWYPWADEALARARELDRPIFLSIGYAACHWCHVMERESFEDESTAALMNDRFVSIKVDREERPDLDDVYMAAVQALTGSGGWPMSVFLTPDLEPFFGGTYFPPHDRGGLPAFRRVLAATADAYRDHRADVVRQARQLATLVQQQLAVVAGNADPEQRQLETAVTRLRASFDSRHGGFGPAPKFPAAMTLEFLLRRWRRDGDPAVREMVVTMLDAMADGGIHDQLGGGFARYSTDAEWLVPHFEKMLYDNALLAHCYLEAFRALGIERYADVARDTLDFMRRELLLEDGGFAAALDADSEGVEGAFYVWSADAFAAALGAGGLSTEESQSLARHWDVSERGNWEGHTVLRRSAAAEPGLVERGRRILLAAREQRPRPRRDDKAIAAWNGLALRAFAAGALWLADAGYAEVTERLVGFIRASLLRPDGGVWRSARDGVARIPGFCEDHLLLADGLLAAHAALGRAEDLLLAHALVVHAIDEFWDPASATFFDTSAEHGAAVARPHSMIDGATPAANSVAADVLQRLALLTGDADLDRRARAVMRAVAPALERQPTLFGRALSAVDRSLEAPSDAVVATPDPEDDRALALRRAVATPYAPNLVVAQTRPGDGLGEWAIFVGKTGVALPTAFVCRGYACDEPTSEPDVARGQVERMAAGS